MTPKRKATAAKPKRSVNLLSFETDDNKIYISIIHTCGNAKNLTGGVIVPIPFEIMI